jgi:hypothetical protein
MLLTVLASILKLIRDDRGEHISRFDASNSKNPQLSSFDCFVSVVPASVGNGCVLKCRSRPGSLFGG